MAQVKDVDPGQARILWIGKRFYTNKDALAEKFGRVYQLPLRWAAGGCAVLLWMIDYHTLSVVLRQDGRLSIRSSPVLGMSSVRNLFAALRMRPQVVVASGDCYVGFMGWLIARLCGGRFIFDIYDKYDEFSGYRRLSWFDPFAFLRRRADESFYCSRGLLSLYADENIKGRTHYVPNGVDELKFLPMDMRGCRRAIGVDPSARVVGYFGSMEPDRGVADLLAAVERLRSEGLDVRLLICGRADPAVGLQQDWIDFRGMVDHETMPHFLNACDLLVVPYRESPVMDMGASCKIAEYLMVERPLVSTRTGNFVLNFPTQALELEDVLCEPGDVAGLARAIRAQLIEKRVASRPLSMGWSAIASAAWAAVGTRTRGGRE